MAVTEIFSQTNPYQIFDAATVKQFDNSYTQNGFRLSDLVLLAAKAIFRILSRQTKDHWHDKKFLILAGPGLNGADGVQLGLLLLSAGATVEIVMPAEASHPVTKELIDNNPSLKLSIFDTSLTQKHFTYIIDALFGVGCRSALTQNWVDILSNLSGEKVIAIDLPSGVNCDTGVVYGFALPADITVTFTAPRPAHFLMPARKLCGQIFVENLDLESLEQNKGQKDRILTWLHFNHIDLWRDNLPWPDENTHKYNRGTLLVAAGADMTGAAQMSAQAAQRVGAGFVKLAVPQIVTTVFKVANLSIVVQPFRDTAQYEAAITHDKTNTILIGPGLGDMGGAVERVLVTLRSKKPCILDAGALSIFAENAGLLIENLHENCIITPHIGEFHHIFPALKDLPKIEKIKLAAKQAGCLILLKGSDTLIADPHGYSVLCPPASPFLATAGTGDVLAGMVGGLYAQGMSGLFACCAAQWIQDNIATNFGPGLIAEDIIAAIPQTLKNSVDASKYDMAKMEISHRNGKSISL